MEISTSPQNTLKPIDIIVRFNKQVYNLCCLSYLVINEMLTTIHLPSEVMTVTTSEHCAVKDTILLSLCMNKTSAQK